MEENVKVNLSESVETPSIQEQETAVLEQAAEKGEIAPESAGVQQDDGVLKINLDKPIEDAVQERKTETVDVEQQARDGQEVEQEVREQPSQETSGSEDQSGTDESPIEYIQDQASDGDDATTTSESRSADHTESETEPPRELEKQPELPDGVDKLVEFMTETGGTLEDYLYLNKDVENMNSVDILKDHYKQKHPDLTHEEISFMLDDEFAYDKDADSEREIKKKQIAYKTAVSSAKQSLKQMRDKFYKDLKFSRGVDLSEDQKEAIAQYEKAKEIEKLNKSISEDYDKKTSQYFNEFKGFEFKLNDKRIRYKVTDVDKTKEVQKNPDQWMRNYVDEKGYLKDPSAWHKAMYAAQNIDKIAQHFYDQGRADTVKENAKKAKNIDMEPRQNHGEVRVDGTNIKVVSGDDSSRLRFKIGKYR